MWNDLLFFYLGGSFVVAMYWWMDSIDGTTKETARSQVTLMVFWPVAVAIYIIGKSMEKGYREKGKK